MSTIFSKIVNGELPCYKVAENEKYLAFLDIMPLRKGHILVIPKKETDYIFDMEDSDLAGLVLFAKEVAVKLKGIVTCKKVGMTVVGLEVPHAHIHLIPIDSVSDMDFSKPKLTLEKEEFEEIVTKFAVT
jgi:histidine triad (HIT) family protein